MKRNVKAIAKFLAGAATATFSAAAFAVPVTIDLFDEPFFPGQSVTDNNLGGAAPTSSYSTVTPDQILGGVRDISIDLLQGGLGQSATLDVTGGLLNWSNSTLSRSRATVQWDGTAGMTLNAVGLGGVDLLNSCGIGGCQSLNAILMGADLGFNYHIEIYTDASNYTVLSSGSIGGIPDNYPAPYVSSYDLDWFGLPSGGYLLGGLPFSITQVGSGADLTDVGALQFIMENTGTCFNLTGTGTEPCRLAVDVSIDSMSAVPEPGSMALVGLGLVGLAGLRRRKSA